MLREVKERLFLCGIAVAAVLTVMPLFHIIYTVAVEGIPVLMKAGLNFLTDTLAPPGEGLGGIGPANFWDFGNHNSRIAPRPASSGDNRSLCS